jgi:hypothetical protein
MHQNTPMQNCSTPYSEGIKIMSRKRKHLLCTIEGCNKEHSGKGLCRHHYMKQYFLDNGRKDKEAKKLWARTPVGMFSHLRSSAKIRKVEFTLDFKTFLKLRELPCHYCGGQLAEASAGIDRKDNSKGYTEENSAACCEACNKAKNSFFTEAEMLSVMEFRRESAIAERMIGSCVP